MARVLIVGDAVIANAVRDTLSRAASNYYASPYELTFDIVDTSSKAVELMRTRNYELVILDLLTARADDAEFIRSIRARKQRSDLPILVMSSVSGIDLHYEFIRDGANDFFSVPLHGPEQERFLRVAFNLILER